MSSGRPRRPSLRLETLVVEVPIFSEADLRALERRCEAVMADTGELRAEVRRLLRTVQGAIERYGAGSDSDSPPRSGLRVVGVNENPRPRRRRG